MNPPGIETLGYQSRNPATYPDFRDRTRVKIHETLETKQKYCKYILFYIRNIPEKNDLNSGIFIQNQNLPQIRKIAKILHFMAALTEAQRGRISSSPIVYIPPDTGSGTVNPECRFYHPDEEKRGKLRRL